MKTIYLSLIILILLSFQNLHAQTSENSSVKMSDENLLKKSPEVSEELLNTEIVLTNDEKIKLADYKNDIIVLCFVTEWVISARTITSALGELHTENLKNVRIIAVSPDDTKSELQNFKKFVKDFKIEFQSGWANKKFTDKFFNITKFRGIPQSFVIKDGKLRGIFRGTSPKINESLMNLVRKISAEANR